MRGSKQTQQLARQLFQLSLVEGQLSAERVAGVLAYIEKHATEKPLVLLRAYQNLVRQEVARGLAVVEHAGPLAADLLPTLEGALSQRYQRPVTAQAQANPDLLAGVRVRIGDDVYESSIAAQLAALAV